MRPALAALLFALAAVASAAPPTLDIPPEVRPSGQYVQFVPKTDAVAVEYVGLDGVEPFPAAFLKDGRAFVLDATGLQKNKAYRFVAVAAGKTGEQSRATFVVVNGKVPTTPPVLDPPPSQPDPPAPDGALYFLIVRPDGPASPAFTRTMGLPEWGQLRAAGHGVKDVSATQAAGLGAVIPADQLPAVLTLREDGAVSRVVRPAVPLPTTGAGVLDLPKGVSR